MGIFICKGWHLCGHVLGNLTNPHQSVVSLLHFDYCIWFSFLHSIIKGMPLLYLHLVI